MHWKSWLKLIGLGLFLWLMAGLDWPRLTTLALTLDPAFLATYLGAFALMVLTRSARLRLVLARISHPLSFRHCYIATLEPALMGLVTPGRVGEFSRVGYLHSHGVSLPSAFGVVLVERLVDVSLLLVIGAAGLMYIFLPGLGVAGVGVLITVALLLLLGLLRKSADVLTFLQARLGWLERWEPAGLRVRRQALSTTFFYILRHTAQPVFHLGLVCNGLNFVQVFLLAKAFHFQADYLVIIFAYSAATLVSLLPISFGGLGTREATYIMIMGQIGISKESALLFSLADGLVFSIFMLFALLLPVWLQKALTRFRAAPRT